MQIYFLFQGGTEFWKFWNSEGALPPRPPPGYGSELTSHLLTANILRPSIRNDELPEDEPRRSIVKVLIDSLWSDDPENRPSFSHIKKILRIVAPLKGDRVEKRAFLLEKEAEALEKYIAQDTRLINKEQDKINEWLSRSLPPDIFNQIQDGEEVDAMEIDHVSVAVFRIVDFQNLVDAIGPDELMCLVEYLIKSFQAVATQDHQLELTDINVASDSFVIGKLP